MFSDIQHIPGFGHDSYEIQRAQRAARALAGDDGGKKENKTGGAAAPAPSAQPVTGLVKGPVAPENLRQVDTAREQQDADGAANKERARLTRLYEPVAASADETLELTGEILYEANEYWLRRMITNHPGDPYVAEKMEHYKTDHALWRLNNGRREVRETSDDFFLSPKTDGEYHITEAEREEQERYKAVHGAVSEARRGYFREISSQDLTPAEVHKKMLEFDISTLQYTDSTGTRNDDKNMMLATLSHLNSLLGVPDTPVKPRVIDVPEFDAPEGPQTAEAAGLLAAAQPRSGPSETDRAAEVIGKIRDETASGERFAKEEEEEKKGEGNDEEMPELGFLRVD